MALWHIICLVGTLNSMILILFLGLGPSTRISKIYQPQSDNDGLVDDILELGLQSNHLHHVQQRFQRCVQQICATILEVHSQKDNNF